MCPEASRTSLQVTYKTRYPQIGNEKCPDKRPDKVPEWPKISGMSRPGLATSAFHNSPYIFQPQPDQARVSSHWDVDPLKLSIRRQMQLSPGSYDPFLQYSFLTKCLLLGRVSTCAHPMLIRRSSDAQFQFCRFFQFWSLIK